MNCPYCNKEALYLTSEQFYGRDFGTNLYVCFDCDARVGTHERTKKPLGTMATKELRELRKQCHSLFDKMWKSGKLTRKQAYKWLQESMEISKSKAHIGMFDEEQCKKLLTILEK